MSLDSIFRNSLNLRDIFQNHNNAIEEFNRLPEKSIKERRDLIDKTLEFQSKVQPHISTEFNFRILIQTDSIINDATIGPDHPRKTLARRIQELFEKFGDEQIHSLIRSSYNHALLNTKVYIGRCNRIGFNLPLIELIYQSVQDIKIIPWRLLEAIHKIVNVQKENFTQISRLSDDLQFIYENRLLYPSEDQRKIHDLLRDVGFSQDLKIERIFQSLDHFIVMTQNSIDPDFFIGHHNNLIVISPIVKKGMLAIESDSFSSMRTAIIGEGTFGKIYSLNYCGLPIALKIINRTEESLEFKKGAFFVQNVSPSPYINTVHSIFKRSIYLEQAKTDLFDLCSRKKDFVLINGLEFIKDMVRGLGVLHFNLLTHGDISISNFLFISNNILELDERTYKLQLADCDSIDLEYKFRGIGTYTYTAPEVAKNLSYLHLHTKKTNCWALGVVIFDMLSKHENFISIHSDPTPGRIFRYIESLSQEEVDEKIERLFHKDTIPFYANYLFSEKMRNLGKARAHEFLIHLGEENLGDPEVMETLRAHRLRPDMSSKAYRQFLFEAGIKKFLSTKRISDLRILFIKSGIEEYKSKEISDHSMDELIISDGERTISIIKSILKGLLQVDPNKRLSLDEILERYILPLETAPDIEFPKSYSLLEVDD